MARMRSLGALLELGFCVDGQELPHHRRCIFYLKILNSDLSPALEWAKDSVGDFNQSFRGPAALTEEIQSSSDEVRSRHDFWHVTSHRT